MIRYNIVILLTISNELIIYNPLVTATGWYNLMVFFIRFYVI